MNREEILEMSRKENKNADLVNETAIRSGMRIASAVMYIVSAVCYVAEAMITEHINYGFFVIMCAYSAVISGYSYFVLRKDGKNGQLNKLFSMICWSICGILVITFFVNDLLKHAVL